MVSNGRVLSERIVEYPRGCPVECRRHDQEPENAVVRILTWRLVSFLFLLYIVAYLDRINLGFAALQMQQQLGFTDSMYGLGAGVWSVVNAQRKTSQAVNDWLRDATSDSNCYPIPLFRIRPSAPALAVAGGLSPRVLLSDAAAASLNTAELEAALKHEIAHVRRRDNLKKLLFRFFVLPGLSALESAWSEAAEMAADDAAVSNSRQALDLASALIKLSRFTPPQKSAVLATGLAHTSGSALNARIARLVSWDETHFGQPSASLLSLGTALSVIATYGVILSDMHKMTEWLVR